MEEIISFRKTIATLLCRRMAYMGEEQYSIDSRGNVKAWNDSSKTGTGVVIAGKRHFFEVTTTFPFTGMKDIKSAVKLNMASYSPFTTELFFCRKIHGTRENTTVNLWFINPDFVDIIEELEPRLIIPETALLPFLSDNLPQIYCVQWSRDMCLLTAIGADSTVKSMMTGCRASDLLRFRRSLGAGTMTMPVNHMDSHEYLTLLPRMISNMPFKALSVFIDWRYFARNFSKRRLINWSLATAGLFFLLSFSCTAYIYYAHRDISMQNQQLSQMVSDIIRMRDTLAKVVAEQGKFAAIINGYACKLPLFNLLNRVLTNDTRLKQFTISDNIVEMRGECVSASRMLEVLSKCHEIKNAKFISPVTTDRKRKKEIFHITFIYVPATGTDQGGDS